jgi:hypothetical protein
MGFINEKISEEDAKKYDFEALSKTLRCSLSNLKYEWTIDWDRNIFLIWLGNGQEEFCMQTRFLLWWAGQIITLSVNNFGERSPDGSKINTWDSPAFAFPDDLKPSHEEVIGILKEALIEFRWAGYNVQSVNHTAKFNF